MFPVRPEGGIYENFRHLQDLFPGNGDSRRNSRSKKSFMVINKMQKSRLRLSASDGQANIKMTD
ncbi:MAG: hypothetical protein A2122_01105 [Candidatus Liptonbacteria bacterium GWB1_49_6]|uniref:Uncharacterized protein n=1 Tax=Candidatus Liptonbacteria bacterium GWB1_49_6 TaxID=1798644 RepID=A0A1G2C6R8_9BACT|nr:MAG: hypothetical protein A2122_01105 [Candidatus Liptonbacteria bacterium GWB1_49_6]